MAVLSFASGLGAVVYPLFGVLISPLLFVFVLPLSFGAGTLAIWSGRKARAQIMASSESLSGNDGLLATVGLVLGVIPFGIISSALTVIAIALTIVALTGG